MQDQKYQGNDAWSEEELRRSRWRIKGIKVSWYAGETSGKRGGSKMATERQVCWKAGDKMSPAYAHFKAQVGKRSPCLPALSCCYCLRPGGGRPAGAPGVSCQTVSPANCCDSSNHPPSPTPSLLPPSHPPASWPGVGNHGKDLVGRGSPGGRQLPAQGGVTNHKHPLPPITHTDTYHPVWTFRITAGSSAGQARLQIKGSTWRCVNGNMKGAGVEGGTTRLILRTVLTRSSWSTVAAQLFIPF